MINKRDISRPRTASDMEMRYQLGQIKQIPNKVDKQSGKSLSKNDFSDSYKRDVENNTKARHVHSNVSLLDTLTEDKVSVWNTSLKSFVLFEGTNTGSVELDNIDYDLFTIIYGDDTYIDSKVLPYTNKQFCLSLTKPSEVVKEFYTFSEKNIQKTSTTTKITIYKVIAYKKGVGA